jgi:hypothetical protein
MGNTAILDASENVLFCSVTKKLCSVTWRVVSWCSGIHLDTMGGQFKASITLPPGEMSYVPFG